VGDRAGRSQVKRFVCPAEAESKGHDIKSNGGHTCARFPFVSSLLVVLSTFHFFGGLLPRWPDIVESTRKAVQQGLPVVQFPAINVA